MKVKLPADIVAEQGFLCSLITSPKLIDKVADKTTRDHFTYHAHKLIWETMLEMWQRREDIDMITLTSALEKAGRLDDAGGIDYVTNTATLTFTSANIDTYFKTMQDCFVRRKIYVSCKQLIMDSLNMAKDPQELQEHASKEITGLSTTSAEARHISEVMNSCINRWEEAATTKGAINRGHESGIRLWDQATRGFRPKTLHVIGGAAKAGKTTSAMQMVVNSAFEKQVPVCIVSLEMAAEELIDKIACNRAKINISDLLDGRLNKFDYSKLSSLINQVSKLPIYIIDEACMTISQFRARCRRMVAEKKVEIIMLDYAQLVEASGDPKNREREVAEISRTCKIIAKELNVCVVLLAQLNEQGFVRESRTFYMDCDSFTKVEKDPENDDPFAYVMQITHNRHGGIRTIPLRFIRHEARFEESE
jgi:replicative DNA helicase